MELGISHFATSTYNLTNPLLGESAHTLVAGS
jgi:hypothetical protein